MRFSPIVSLGGLALLASCAPVDPGLGEALKYDMAAQTIDPDPVYPADSAKPGDAGTTAAAAARRYRTDTVKPVERLSSSTSSSSSSGSGPK